VSLPAQVTRALLTRAPAVFHGGVEDLLLSGLVVAVADWCRRHGPRGAPRSTQADATRGLTPRRPASMLLALARGEC